MASCGTITKVTLAGVLHQEAADQQRDAATPGFICETQDGGCRRIDYSYSKRISSMVTVEAPPYQKPMASWLGEVRLIPLATIGILMSW